MNLLENVGIISIKEMTLKTLMNTDILFVDEAHRLYPREFVIINEWLSKYKKTCVFSYDEKQMMSKTEIKNNSARKIEEICKTNLFSLTKTIRTNKEISLFITCLFDLKKFRKEYSFPNVKIIFKEDINESVKIAKGMEKKGYYYVSYTSSFFYPRLDFQETIRNTHRVIGQEYDNVVMILDDNFQYIDGKLIGKTHPNPDYLFEKLLYEGLTRTRSKLFLIINNKDILNNILDLLIDS